MTKEEACRTAAKWWREAYTNPRFNNGDDSINGGIGMMMAMMLTKNSEKDQLQKFEDTLYDSLMQEDITNRFSFGVDYAPDRILADACEVSGVCIHNSPWKTILAIHQNSPGNYIVEAKSGYGASWNNVTS